MSAVDLDRLRPDLATLGRAPTAADVASAMRRCGMAVTDSAVLETVAELRRDTLGAGPLDALLREPGVTDVLVNGPDQVFVDRGSGLEQTAIRFGSDADVRRLAARLAASAGRRLDDASPYVDARMNDGVRVHAVLGSLAAPGTCLSLRVPSRIHLSLDEWVERGSLHPVAADVLRQVVAVRVAYLVSGGTGTGKTTLLAALLGLVPHRERLLIVEDSRELAPDHPHCVRLEARPPNGEGIGAVELAVLVRQALRMRPDRVVLGEARGAEICDLLTALNTGHEGGCGTVHANSADDVPARIEALAALGGLDRNAVHAQLASAVEVFVHIRRGPSGHRQVAQISVARRDGEFVRAEPALLFDDTGARRGPGCARLERVLGR
ncbi:TadA family conjugal transfer-associated ATPase [Naumannella huperziae]